MVEKWVESCSFGQLDEYIKNHKGKEIQQIKSVVLV